jgi:hypothetical protein
MGVSERAYARGPDHPMWTEVPTYTAVHQRIARALGSARDRACVCGQPAEHWAWQPTGHSQTLWEDGMPFSTDLRDYAPRCVPCHKREDLARIKDPRVAHPGGVP